MKVFIQVLYVEFRGFLYSWSVQQEREIGKRLDGGEEGLVMEELENYIKEFCFYFQGNGTL